jgi:hypothetical protein
MEPGGIVARPTGMRSAPVTIVKIAALLAVLTGCSANDPGSPAATSSAPTATTATGAATTGPAATPATAPPTAGGPASGSPSAAQAVRVVLTRSGGIAGLNGTVTVEPDGRWTVVERGGAARTGRLSGSDLDRLRRLAADPRLAAEATRTPGPTECRDAFSYQLTVGGTVSRYIDCPSDAQRPPVTAALVELLTRATAR